MPKDDKPKPFADEEYSVRLWRSGVGHYSVTLSKNIDGEREVTRKVVTTAARAGEIACDFLTFQQEKLI